LFASSWSSHPFSRRFRVVSSVSMGEAAKPRWFCCAHVAVSMAKLQNLSRLEFLLVLWRGHVYGESCKDWLVLLRSRRRVYGGSCKTYPVSSFCVSSGVAVSMGKAAKTRLFCCAHVAVSMREAAKPRWFCCAHFAVSMGETAKPIPSRVSPCPLAWPCLWGRLQSLACFAALASPCLWGKLQNLLLRTTLCKLCSTK